MDGKKKLLDIHMDSVNNEDSHEIRQMEAVL